MEPLEAVFALYVSNAGFQFYRPVAAVHQATQWTFEQLAAMYTDVLDIYPKSDTVFLSVICSICCPIEHT